MKKTLAIILACTLLALGGCAHTHTWTEATCEQPRTCTQCGMTEGEPLGHEWEKATCEQPQICSRCGQTQGEALGHAWTEATCTAPKTCSRCKATEGEPLGHTPTEATYLRGSVCSVCGETLSEPLEPDFEKYGLDAYLAGIGTQEHFTYTTCGYQDDKRRPEYDAVADVCAYGAMLVDESDHYLGSNWLRIGEQQQDMSADQDLVNLIRRVESKEKDPYEWRGLYVEIRFTDRPNGYSVAMCSEDYFDIVGHDESSQAIETDERSYNVYQSTVHYWDGDQNVYWIQYTRPNSFGDGWLNCENYYYVPQGYKGCVWGLYDGALSGETWEDGTYIFDYMNENMLLFRLEPQESRNIPASDSEAEAVSWPAEPAPPAGGDAPVYDAFYYDRDTGHGGIEVFRIPAFRLDGQEIDALNQEIFDELSQKLFQGDKLFGDECAYRFAQNGDVLSLVIKLVQYDQPHYYVYNLSASEKRLLSDNEVLNACGISEEDYRDRARHALGSVFWDLYGEELNDPERRSQLPLEMMEQCLQNTISDEIIDTAQPYIDESGHLCAAGHVGVNAESGHYYVCVDLEDFRMSVYYSEHVLEG